VRGNGKLMFWTVLSMNSLFHMVKQVRYIGVIHLILFDKLPCSINKIQGLVGSHTVPTKIVKKILNNQ
jgi:hypothetical protein